MRAWEDRTILRLSALRNKTGHRHGGEAALAAGLPLGAILTTNRVASGMHPGMHGTTFGGGPLACAVAIEFLRILDGMMGHIRELGDYFHAELETLKAKYTSIREVRGMGLMLASNWIRPTQLKPWLRDCCNAKSLSIALTKRFCGFCRLTSLRRTMWTR